MQIRKIHRVSETLVTEAGRPVDGPLRLTAVAAVIRNPWHGLEFIEDMTGAASEIADELGELLTMELDRAVPGVLEAYGKAAIVGTEGEIEHGSALIHTLRFGDHLRGYVHGTTLLPAVEKRSSSGSSFDIPLKHILDATTRSHHQTFEVTVADAPHPDEIVIAMAGSTGGRPLARLEALVIDA